MPGDERERDTASASAVAKHNRTKPQDAPGPERPDGSPLPADPRHRQPADIRGESLTTPGAQPGRNPNPPPGRGRR
jgi:hypothetical protein